MSDAEHSTDQQGASGRPGSLPSPDRMREVVAEYVSGIHDAYVRQARMLPPAVQGRLALVAAGAFSVAAVGARHLHLVATTETLGSGARGEVVEVGGEAGPLRWTMRFYDPVVLPALGLVDERDGPAPDEIRRILGVRTHIYHLTLTPSSGLAAHHAGHTGTGLANAHAAAAREHESIRAAVGPTGQAIAEELEGAELAGLPIAAGLLARQLAPDDTEVERLAADRAPAAELRRAVLHAVRPVPTVGGRLGGR